LTVSGISYPGGFSGNWSGGTIAAGASQQVTVTFSPTSATSYNGAVTVNSDSTGGTNTTTASGTGVAATRVIELSGNLAFGNATIGSSKTSTLTISNSGNSALNVSSISYPSGFSGSWLGGTIAAGGSQNMTVTFSPTSLAGYLGAVTVNTDATGGTGTLMASGTGTIDLTPPSIGIVSPTSETSYSTNSNLLSLSGTASDDLAVARVEWTNDRGGSGTAAGTTNWSISNLVLQDGANLITVTAFDAIGNSRAVTLAVTYSSWVDFKQCAGAYSGLVKKSGPDGDYIGFWQFTVTTKGAFTSKLVLYWADQLVHTYQVAGNFGHDGNPTLWTLKEDRAVGPWMHDISFKLNASQNVVAGNLVVGLDSAIFTANRHRWNAKTNSCPDVGRYTVALERDENNPGAPRGQGIGTVTVSKVGVVKLRGKLADGTPITQSATISQDGLWPFYASLYAKTGYISGPISFVAAAPKDLEGVLDWSKSAHSNDRYYTGGFQARLTLSGNRYQAPSRGMVVMNVGFCKFVLQNGELGVIEKEGALTPANKLLVLNPAADKLKLSLGLSTGMISGSFIHPATGKVVSVWGVLLQPQDCGVGFFLGTTESGLFELNAEHY
jgi:hypothetical protein